MTHDDDTPLATLLERAQGERDTALAALRQAEEMARRAEAQTAQLLDYRAEYRERWHRQFSQQGAIEIVHCYQSFMQRLDEAIAQQQQQAATAQAHCTRGAQRLAEAELRVASVKKLIERRQAERRRVLARREQRQSDETSQQLHWRQSRAEPVH